MKKVVFKVGDTARVVIPKVVVRVGYPKAVSDYEKEVEDRFGADIASIFSKLSMGTTLYTNTKAKVVHELAYMLAKQSRFGGPIRSVHLKDMPEAAGQKFYIYQLKTFMEGRYHPGSGGSYEHSYDDGEPPSLSVTRAVRVAYGQLERPPSIFSRAGAPSDLIRIPVAHLELESLQ